MKLEEEIKQGRFRSERQKLSINIVYTANWLNGIVSGTLKKSGLTVEQFNILRILRGQHPKPATVNLLIDRMMNKMSNASRLVEKLRIKGLAERKICTGDRRACDVLITQKGLQLLAKLDKSEQEWHNTTASLNATEVKTLNRLLDKLRG